MLFNSIPFAIFFIIVFSVYWICPHKFRWTVILISGYCYYASWNLTYLLLLLLCTAITYSGAVLIEKNPIMKKRRMILTAATLGCLFMLFVFKYFNFFYQEITSAICNFREGADFPVIQILLPAGISFYTLQAIAYMVDVYKQKIKPEHHIGYYAAYISFFPLVQAGPIERAGNIIPQFRENKKFLYEQATYGLKIFIWGLFKKMLIADMLTVYVDKVFSDVHSYQGLALVIVSVFFTIQLYCDFSGYSDMARGIAALLGIDIMNNFKNPLFSKSMKEFWGRWHIALSSWFRDYVYIPLGGSRCTKLKNARNLMITFILSGLWHGANWTYLVWGGIHGLAQIIEKTFVKKHKNTILRNVLATIIVFSVVVWAFVFFRADSLGDAGYIISHYFTGILSPISYLKTGYISLEITGMTLVKIILPMIIMVIFDFISLKVDVIKEISKKKLVIRWSIYIAFTFFILFYLQYLIGSSKVAQKFIYSAF